MRRGWVENMRTERRAGKRKEAGMGGERESSSSLHLPCSLLSSSFSDFPSLPLSPHLDSCLLKTGTMFLFLLCGSQGLAVSSRKGTKTFG